MKKLIFVFVALFMVVLISGCGARQNTIRFDDETASIGEESMEDGHEESELDEDHAEELEAMEEETDAMDSEGKEEEDMDDEKEEAMEKLDKPDAKVSGKLSVTSFDGAFLKSNLSYNVVKGTVPSGTHTIKVNDYKLSKFVPGQTQWDYIAATRFGTLKDGLNNYVVKSFDKSGKQTGSVIFSIDYEAPMIPEVLPGVGAGHWLALLAALISLSSYAVFRRLKWL